MKMRKTVDGSGSNQHFLLPLFLIQACIIIRRRVSSDGSANIAQLAL